MVIARNSKDDREAFAWWLCVSEKKTKMMRANSNCQRPSSFHNPSPPPVSTLPANTLPSLLFRTYFMLFNAPLLFWSFKARFKRARCWIIILKRRRGGRGLHKSRKIWAGQGNKHGFQLPFCRPLLQMSPVVIPSRDFKRGAAPLAPSAHTFQVSITRGRASWSLSCEKCQHFAIDLTHSIHKDGASFVREGWGERPFGKVI